MIRYWLIPLLLFAGMETRNFAATVGDPQLVAVARVDHNGMLLNTSDDGVLLEKDERTAKPLSPSFFTWYGSNAVHNIRLILAGALGFLLVLVGLHLLIPSSKRQPDSSNSPPCSTNACGCSHSQHAPHANHSATQRPVSGANVGDFLPLGISLNHLNAIGQQLGSHDGKGSEQYEDLTAKITELEERLRQVTRDASASAQQQDSKAIFQSLSGQASPDRHDATAKSKTESSDIRGHATDDPTDDPTVGPNAGQQNGTPGGRSGSKRERKAAPDPLFDGLISETLAVINSQ